MMASQINSYEELIERIWEDEALKNRFITDPKVVLAEVGASVPDSLTVEVHENTGNLRNYVLLKKEQLEGLPLEGEDPLVGQVLQKALTDDSFKAKLRENPKATIAEEIGQPLPESLEIRIYEDTPGVKHLVIPLNPKNEELSDLELEMVAGGRAKPPSGPRFPQPGTTGMIASQQWFR